jgi:hypothetical protein
VVGKAFFPRSSRAVSSPKRIRSAAAPLFRLLLGGADQLPGGFTPCTSAFSRRTPFSKPDMRLCSTLRAQGFSMVSVRLCGSHPNHLVSPRCSVRTVRKCEKHLVPFDSGLTLLLAKSLRFVIRTILIVGCGNSSTPVPAHNSTVSLTSK